MIRTLAAKITNGDTVLILDETPLHLARYEDVPKIGQRTTPHHVWEEHPYIVYLIEPFAFVFVERLL